MHLKQSVVADIPAAARVVTDPDDRRPLIEAAARRWGRTDVPTMLLHSPLIVLTVEGDMPYLCRGRAGIAAGLKSTSGRRSGDAGPTAWRPAGVPQLWFAPQATASARRGSNAAARGTS